MCDERLLNRKREVSGFKIIDRNSISDTEAENKGLSKFTVLGDSKNLVFKGGVSITRAPWPFFDVSGSKLIIGNQVVISSGVHILTHSHEFKKSNWRTLHKIEYTFPTVIEEFAFIGINSIITDSCKYIGRCSVIGAGSVVTKNVPDYEVWVGNPARKVADVERVE